MYFNIHDLITIEIENPPLKIRESLNRRFQFFKVDELKCKPNIKVMFVPRIEVEDSVNYIGYKVGITAAYTSDRLWLNFPSGTILIKPVQLEYNEQMTQEIYCEHNVESSVLFNLLLFLFIQELLLTKDATLVHASSVFFNNFGLVFAAWRDTGKTSTIINYLRAGAEYLGDDLVILTGDGSILCIPEYLNISSVELIDKHSPARKKLYSWGSIGRRKIKAPLKALGKVLNRIPIFPFDGLGGILIEYSKPSPLNLVVSLTELFPQAKIRKVCHLDYVIFIIRSKRSEISVQSVEKNIIIDKMLSSLIHEEDFNLPSVYQIIRYAFPEKIRIMQNREIKFREILEKSFNNKPCYFVQLPQSSNPNKIIQTLQNYLKI
jgi:hypothetical protein